jgi:hypothetical protein
MPVTYEEAVSLQVKTLSRHHSLASNKPSFFME